MQVAQSLFAASSVGALIASEYDIGPVQTCYLHMSGINDVYQVIAEHGTFFFKVYRHGWRSVSNVRYEAELLQYLRQAGISVALPVPNRKGAMVIALDAPEGERPAVLYQAATGSPPTWPFYQNTDEARLLGAALAQLHNKSRSFTSSQARDTIDADALLNAPLAILLPSAALVPDGLARFPAVGEKLRGKLVTATAQGLTTTICHGDFHCGNVFLGEGGQVTLFDFDACGPGWVAFDLARWRSLTGGTSGEASWEAFLAGYTSVAPLTDADREAVPLFVALRLLHGAHIKLTFIRREQWDRWDVGFFLDDLLNRLEA